MAGPNTLELAAAAKAEGLEAILVGGNAVNLHTYRRTTFDVDLLVREEDAARWRSFFEGHGYQVFHATPNSVRMRFATDPAAALPVDLMLADAPTFRRIQEASRMREIGHDQELSIPDPLHLIAMKLHALRSPQRVAEGVDFSDVLHLIRLTKIDVTSDTFAAILARYATEAIRERLLRELQQNGPAE